MTNRRTQLHIRIILNCFNLDPCGSRPGLTNEDQLPTTHCAGFCWSLISRFVDHQYVSVLEIRDQYQWIPLIMRGQYSGFTHIRSSLLIPDPRASIDLLQVSQPWIRDQFWLLVIS